MSGSFARVERMIPVASKRTKTDTACAAIMAQPLLDLPCAPIGCRGTPEVSIMGISIMAREWLQEDRRRRDAERLAAEQAAQAAAEAYHAEFLDRQRAADFLGLSVHKLKRLVAEGRAPACVKNGEAKQATVRWPIAELRAYKADPVAYVAARAGQGSPA